MNITLHWICGIGFGLEFTTNTINDMSIGYCLVDVGVVRVQLAWYID